MGLAAIEKALSVDGDQLAMVGQDGQRLSRTKLMQVVDGLSTRMHHLGIGPGLSVAPIADNDALRFCLWLAIWNLGANLVLVSDPKAALSAGITIDHVISLPGQRRTDGPVWHEVQSGWHRDAGPPPPRNSAQGRVYFTTSGSTGIPKFMSKPLGMLMKQAEAIVESPQGPRGPVLIGFPTTSTAALSTALIALLAGQACVFPGGPIRDVLRTAKEVGVTALATNPLVLAQIVDAVEQGADKPNFKVIGFTGASAEHGVLRRAWEAFNAPILTVAALNETPTLTMGIYAGQTLPEGWAGTIAPGVTLELRDCGQWPDLGTDVGRLAVKVPPEFQVEGYIGGEPAYDESGWIETGDLAEITDQGVLLLRGRADFIINIGGNKYAPEPLERAIARFPDVKRAGAAPTTVNGRDGLGVAVVSQGVFDEYAAVAALERIVRCEGVVRFVVVDELPVLESGKLNRLAIAKMTRDT